MLAEQPPEAGRSRNPRGRRERSPCRGVTRRFSRAIAVGAIPPGRRIVGQLIASLRIFPKWSVC